VEGEGLSELRRQRARKLESLRKRGIEPFALGFDRTHTIEEGLGLFADAESTGRENARTEPVRVAGRVVRHRSQGKAGFADIVDQGGKIQLYAQVDHVGQAGMELFNELDLGDIVGAEGAVFRTRRGEVSVELTQLTLLTKALRPLPDKWHGLRDTELRFRQRHLDFIVNSAARDVITMRSRMIAHMRRFLDADGFLEVETPVLHQIAGGAAARPFTTHHNALDIDLYLRIAEELHLKRMIVGGFERVYEIGRVFRNEGVDATHNPEFTILELYQAYSDLDGMMNLTESLIKSTARELLGSESLLYSGDTIDISGEWERQEMLALVAQHLPGGNIDEIEGLRRRAAELESVNYARMDWGELVYEIFERAVGDKLRSPVFVTGFPVSVSPLARRRADDPRLADRFELFIAGQELANAFNELTDPLDQRERLEQQVAARAAGDEEAHPMDEDFIAALEQGMPPTGGLGIGIDRLAMLFADVSHIRNVLAFPLMRHAPEEA
jgi:lysyl-tRNA synthetase class 2